MTNFKFKDRVKVISGFYTGMIGRIVIISKESDSDGNYSYMLVASKTISHKSKFGDIDETTTTETTQEIWVNQKDLIFIGELKKTFMDYLVPLFGILALIGILFLKSKSITIKDIK